MWSLQSLQISPPHHLNRIFWRSSFAMAGVMWSLTSRCSLWVHSDIASLGGAEFHCRTLKPCDGVCLCWQNVVANWLPMDRWNGTGMMNWLEAWNQFKLGLVLQMLERRLDEHFHARARDETYFYPRKREKCCHWHGILVAPLIWSLIQCTIWFHGGLPYSYRFLCLQAVWLNADVWASQELSCEYSQI